MTGLALLVGLASLGGLLGASLVWAEVADASNIFRLVGGGVIEIAALIVGVLMGHRGLSRLPNRLGRTLGRSNRNRSNRP